jgi:hypothetical protein
MVGLRNHLDVHDLRPHELIQRAAIMAVVLVLAAGCRGGGVSDEDLIERFIKDVTGDVDDAYTARVLGYVDMERVPIDVRVPRHAGLYQAERAPELIGAFKRIIEQRFQGSKIKLRSDKYEIKGDSADVRLGLMTAVSPLSADLGLSKTAPGTWKVSRVHIEP